MDLVPILPDLKRYAYKLTGNRDAANDLVQETCVRVLAKLHLYEAQPGKTFRAWAFTVMHHRFISMRRLAVNRTQTVSLDEIAPAPDPAENPHDSLVYKRALAAAGRLDPDRAWLVLRAAEGYEMEDLAATLNMPLGTVKSRLSRARAALREAI